MPPPARMFFSSPSSLGKVQPSKPFAVRHYITLLEPFLLIFFGSYATIVSRPLFPMETSHEIEIPAVGFDSASNVSPRPVRIRNRQALRGRILLQGEVGICRRVFAAVQKEPLPTAEEAGGDGPHAQGLDGPAALPHDRRRALGLSRDHRVQEFDGCE